MTSMKTDVVVRPEQLKDLAAIRGVNLAAFPQAAEADLVDVLRTGRKTPISLVAVHAEHVIGHILFSPVMPESNDGQYLLLGMGPLGVLPDSQGQGVGSLLVTTGLDHCTRLGVGCVVVLGPPDYYSRFGFRTASQFGIGCEYDVPDRHFMVAELADGALSHISGTVRYQPEFLVAGPGRKR